MGSESYVGNASHLVMFRKLLKCESVLCLSNDISNLAERERMVHARALELLIRHMHGEEVAAAEWESFGDPGKLAVKVAADLLRMRLHAFAACFQFTAKRAQHEEQCSELHAAMARVPLGVQVAIARMAKLFSNAA